VLGDALGEGGDVHGDAHGGQRTTATRPKPVRQRIVCCRRAGCGARPRHAGADQPRHVGRHGRRLGGRIGLFSTTQQIGAALGLAILATLAASRTDERLAAGATEAAALTAGYRLAVTVAAGVVLVALAVVATALGRTVEPAADQPKQASAVAG